MTTKMYTPPHPGLIVKDAIKNCGLTITEAAGMLGVTRQALTNLVGCKAGISPAMAKRLAITFGSTEETWLRLQISYDLWLLKDMDLSGVRKADMNEKANISA